MNHFLDLKVSVDDDEKRAEAGVYAKPNDEHKVRSRAWQ